jgi:predicted DNA-binding transcriptional regulator YafY
MRPNRGAVEQVSNDHYMTNGARAVRLYRLLLQGYHFTVIDIMKRFRVSRRTVYSILEDLRDAGVKVDREKIGKYVKFSISSRTLEHVSDGLDR